MRIYLIRHGQTDWNREGRVMGIRPVGLNRTGRESVERTAEYLDPEGIERIYSSTLRRTMEISRILSSRWGVDIASREGLNESPFEEWTGLTYGELKGRPDFDLYRSRPTLSKFSREEGMRDIQSRAVAVVEGILGSGPVERAAMVSHSDVIKPILAHYLEMDLDLMHRLSIANASVTLLEINPRFGPRLRYMNLGP
jgi:broad specificity phosphatase PhoE